jgi:nucleoside-diphosphate-sugar epimerase
VSKLPIEDLEHVLHHTRDLWADLRGKQLFITGGTGFFGRWILETFTYANDRLALDASAVVLTRNPNTFRAKAPHLAERDNVKLLQGDVRDFNFPDGDFSHIIHAGTTSSAPVEPLEMFETIVQGTRRVLDFAATHNTNKFLFVSSGAVYGKQPPEIRHIPEDYCGAPDPRQSNSAYGEGKRAAELLSILMANRYGFETKIARCFAFVGPHLPLDAHFAIGNFIRDTLENKPIHIQGDGTPHRSYLYAADLAIWLWTVLFRGKSGKAYNVGSDLAISISELGMLIKEVLNGNEDLKIDREPIPNQLAERYIPLIQSALSDLQLKPHIDLTSSIKKTADWHRSLSGQAND